MDNEKIKELTLLLIYLTSWEEKQLDEKVLRAWKGYDFGVLNELDQEDLIIDNKRSKSIYLSDEGTKKAKELMEKYNI